MKSRYGYVAFFGLLTALALLLSFLESMISVPIAVPGIKIGLANLVVIFMLYRVGTGKALLFSICRVILAALLFSGFSGFLFSLAGAFLSWGIMAFLKKSRQFSLLGVSLVGGVSHNLGQLITAAIFTQSPGIIPAYLPVLIIAGAIMGAINGTVATGVMRALKIKPVTNKFSE